MEMPILCCCFFPVRKEAIPLVDAFDFPDAELNSALGRYDGDVYSHLYKWAQKAPRNREQVETMDSRILHRLCGCGIFECGCGLLDVGVVCITLTGAYTSCL